MHRVGLTGLVLCVVGGGLMLAALAVDLDSDGAKGLMIAAAACFVPGSLLTLAYLRAVYGKGP